VLKDSKFEYFIEVFAKNDELDLSKINRTSDGSVET